MPKARKPKKPLRRSDFCGEGEPYSEIIVTISIRVLGAGITRSRLAVNSYPDPALRSLAIESLRQKEIDSYGRNEEGVFGACLSENFNGWEDMNKDYPRIKEERLNAFYKKDAQAMNAYIKKSVDWIMELHTEGMTEAAMNDAVVPASSRVQ